MAPVQPRTRTLSEVKAKLLNPATTSHFQVSIGQPPGDFRKFLGDVGAFNDQDRLNLLCSDASLPGSQFATAEITNDFTGVTERHVHRRMYDQKTDLTFYCDAEQYMPIRFFEAWIKYITNERSGGSRNENFSYRMKFPNKYKGPLEVTKFEKNIHSKKSVQR